jgi:hypothetical protein
MLDGHANFSSRTRQRQLEQNSGMDRGQATSKF